MARCGVPTVLRKGERRSPRGLIGCEMHLVEGIPSWSVTYLDSAAVDALEGDDEAAVIIQSRHSGRGGIREPDSVLGEAPGDLACAR